MEANYVKYKRFREWNQGGCRGFEKNARTEIYKNRIIGYNDRNNEKSYHWIGKRENSFITHKILDRKLQGRGTPCTGGEWE